MKTKELRVARAALIENARALIAGDAPTAEQTAQFDAMMVEADRMKGQIDRIELADERQAEVEEALRAQAGRRGTDVDQEREAADLEAGTLSAWMRRGASALNEEQRAVFARRFKAAQSEGTNTAGGYVVSPDLSFMSRIVDAQKAYGGMINAAYVFETSTGAELPIPTDNDTANTGAILGENTQVSTQDVTFGSISLNAYTYSSKLVLVSNQLLQDAAFDLDTFLATKLGTRLARITNTHFTVGTGSNQPTGVVAAATLGYTASGGSTGGEVATVTTDDLIELEHSVDPAYRLNARFMMSDAMLKVVKKLKDSQNRPLWLSGIAVKEPDTINGYPYVINQDMPVPAASAKAMLFGDFQHYYIRRVTGVQMLRLTERYADFGQVGFLAFQRWDGDLIDAGTHPVKYLQMDAS